jgi:chemotaxis protein MotB
VAGKGGGAWKVAYADFVTAMMAFFLVMWICGQDQNVKHAVSFYFNDPFSSSDLPFSKRSTSNGAMIEKNNSGNVPLAESVALGHGRNPYLRKEPNSVCTKLLSDWIHTDKTAKEYWRDQAQRQRDLSRWNKQNEGDREAAERIALRELSRQLKEEIKRDLPDRLKNPYRDLLVEAIAEVNWTELAEDLLGQ